MIHITSALITLVNTSPMATKMLGSAILSFIQEKEKIGINKLEIFFSFYSANLFLGYKLLFQRIEDDMMTEVMISMLHIVIIHDLAYLDL